MKTKNTEVKTKKLEDLEDTIGYRFQDRQKLKTALTHSSALEGYDNEKLEYLGDRCIGLAIANYLFDEYPEYNEGSISIVSAYIVSNKNLQKIAEKIKLGDYMFMGKTEYSEAKKNQNTIAGKGVEALVGAVFLDNKYFFITYPVIINLFEEVIKDSLQIDLNIKNKIQEFTQKKGLPLPEYTHVKTSGQKHKPEFTFSILVKGYEPALGTGENKKQAQQNAAHNFFQHYKKEIKQVVED